jgi:glutathione synthase/RimK-type ligase-like ATP-grasp enzyme/gamma-glutamyl:cysteine ligase YbdK (ATP-grasp superfamily)
VNERRLLFVVSDRHDAAALPTGKVVLADEYLSGENGLAAPGVTVVNLCRSYRYRTRGYYVSLLADARGQRVIPTVETIEGLSEPFGVVRALEEAGVPTASRGDNRPRRVVPERGTAGGTESGEDIENEGHAEVHILLGSCDDRRFEAAAGAIYREWPAPILGLRLIREAGVWMVARVAPVALHALRPPERERFAALTVDEAGVLGRGAPRPRVEMRASVAVLVDPDDVFSPSTPETIDRLEEVGARLQVHFRRIGLDDIGRLGEYDALWIRALTGVREPAFQFALRAEALGMPVIDDSQSIIRCSNKVFLEELLRREGVATPRTMVVTARTPWSQVRELREPIVIKLPDGSFSAAVHKVSTGDEYQKYASEMFRQSPLIIAQEYLPTEFDWRVTVLGGQVLFTAKYHMVHGHWQIRSEQGASEDYGSVEAVPRDRAPRAVVDLALNAAALIGDGLYGVDIKETPRGPVVIEINDNPNLDRGEDDAADGDRIYEDVAAYFLRRVEEVGGAAAASSSGGRSGERRAPAGPRRHYRPFEVAGMELEYAVVDRDLEPVSLVEKAFRDLAGRPTSDVELDGFGFSNEIADHVLELKTLAPTASLATAEELLASGVRKFIQLLRDRWDARLLPTGMHPWMDPSSARIWSRSNSAIYETYGRIFDIRTHGWMNVHASHVNLPLGRESEGIALHNAAVLLVPYLPALAASSPVYDGRLQPSLDGRMKWILEHQAEIPESQGQLVPEYVDSFGDYRKNVLGPMYAALDLKDDSGRLRHEFLNARAAVFRFGRKALEIRVLDTQECVRMDVAVAVFVRTALRHLTRRLLTGKLALPAHALLVADLRATVSDGTAARVLAPHFGEGIERAADGTTSAREVLRALLAESARSARRDEAGYLDLVEGIIESGSLAERIRATLAPMASDEPAFRARLRQVYTELADCLEHNEPWSGRTTAVQPEAPRESRGTSRS